MIDLIIARENGKSLCSVKNPKSEAFQFIDQMSSDSEEIFISGLGAGYHVLLAEERFRDKKIYVFECRQQLIDSYIRQVPLSKVIFIHTLSRVRELGSKYFENFNVCTSGFKPCWGESWSIFQTALDIINGRLIPHIEVLQHVKDLSLEQSNKYYYEHLIIREMIL